MQHNRMESDDDELQKPDSAASFLTARELQARAPAKNEPPMGDAESPRDERGSPGSRTYKTLKKPKSGKPNRSS